MISITEAKKMLKNKKGFSLVETMVAIFVFSIIMTFISGSFIGFMSNFTQQKKEQQMVENAQYALSLMEKTIRTSVVKTLSGSKNLAFSTSDGQKIMLYDNSQSKCLAYWYDSSSSNKKIVMLTKSGTQTSISDCGNFTIAEGYSPTDLTSAGIIESVSVKGFVSEAGKPGLVSVSFTVKDSSQSNSVVVGMSASLRDTEVAP